MCRCNAAILSTKKEKEGKEVRSSNTTFMSSHFKPSAKVSQQDSRRVSYHVLLVIFFSDLSCCKIVLIKLFFPRSSLRVKVQDQVNYFCSFNFILIRQDQYVLCGQTSELISKLLSSGLEL